MAYFRYEAVDRSGKRITGRVESSSELEAIRLLTTQGLTVVRIVEQKKTKSFLDLSGMMQLSLSELATFSRQLSTMVGAGVRIRDALMVLSEQPVFSKRFRRYIRNVVIALEQGKSFADALKEQKVFDPIFINLVRAGETGGVLDETLDKIAAFYEDTFTIQNEVKSAMAYPKFILGFAVLLVFVITLFILPNLISAFGSVPKTGMLGLLMGLNRLLKAHWPVLMVVFAAGFVGFKLFMNTRSGKSFKEFVGMLIPPVRALRMDMSMERFCKTFATLIESGVGLEESLRMAADVSESNKIKIAVEEAIEDIRGGETVSRALMKKGIFPRLVISMISTGEETGRVGEVMEKVARFYSERVRTGVKRLVSMVEPIMIVMIGGFIAFLAYTMYTAIFSMQRAIGG